MLKFIPKTIEIIFGITFIIILLSCNFNEKTYNLSQEFNLKKGEVIRISQTNLRITMKGAGHDITESGENAYCSLELNYNENYSDREVYLGHSVRYDKYSVEIIAVDEKGGAMGSDPFANTNCTIIVRRENREVDK